MRRGIVLDMRGPKGSAWAWFARFAGAVLALAETAERERGDRLLRRAAANLRARAREWARWAPWWPA